MAVEHVHAPGAISGDPGALLIRGAGPVVPRSEVEERGAILALAISYRIGDGGVDEAIVDQALQLKDVGQAPVALSGAVAEATLAVSQATGEIQGLEPGLLSKAVRIPQPDQPRQVVAHGAIAVVREARDGPGYHETASRDNSRACFATISRPLIHVAEVQGCPADPARSGMPSSVCERHHEEI